MKIFLDAMPFVGREFTFSETTDVDCDIGDYQTWMVRREVAMYGCGQNAVSGVDKVYEEENQASEECQL